MLLFEGNMIIPANLVISYEQYSLELLAREPRWRNSQGISVVQGTYLPHQHHEKHSRHFQSGQDALKWMKDQRIIVPEKVFTADSLFHFYEVPAIADGLVELIHESHQVGSRKAFIRSVSSSYVPLNNSGKMEQQGYATIYTALYR